MISTCHIPNSHQMSSNACQCHRPFCQRALKTFIKFRSMYLNHGNTCEKVHHCKDSCNKKFCQFNQYKIMHACTKSIGIGDLRDLYMKENLVIYCHDISRFASQFCENENIFVLTVSMATFFTLQNPYLHRIYRLDKREKQQLKKKYGKLSYFPKIRHKDIFIQYLGGKPTDLVCVERKNYQNVEAHVYYRYVV